MIVVCDIGNTAVHLALYHRGEVSQKYVFLHNRQDDYSPLEMEMEKWRLLVSDKNTLTAFAFAGVYTPLEKCITRFWAEKLPVFKVTSCMDVGIDIDYSPREKLGVDRFVNIVGFHNRYTSPGVIIDFGSALTIDVINPQGGFDGGLIYPGPALSVRSLHTNTALLPEVSLAALYTQRGKTTEQSIQYGIYSVYRHYMDSLINQIRSEFSPHAVSVVATGGWSAMWQKEWQSTITFEPDLTLRGIGDVYYRING